MSIWRNWQADVVTQSGSRMCPCLVRFAHGWPNGAAHARESPAKLFPSYWANVAFFSDRERDYFVQCVEYIRYGVGMSATPAVVRAMDRLAAAAGTSSREFCETIGGEEEMETEVQEAAVSICEVVLMPDGRPCMGWFLDNFDCCHYAAVVAALEERWRFSAGSLWALRDRSITAQMNAMTASNRKESMFSESAEWTTERMHGYVGRHKRLANKNNLLLVGESVDRIHRLSLSLLDESKKTDQQDSLLSALRNCIASIKDRNERNVSYPVICRAFGCLLALKPSAPHFMEFRSKVHTLGAEICSVEVDDTICKVYQQHVRDSVDVASGKMPTPLPVPFISSELLNAAVLNLLKYIRDIDQVMVWFPRVVALCLLAPTPRGRDGGIRAAVLAVACIENYLDAYEAAVLQQHVSIEKTKHAEGEESCRGDVGLLDNVAWDRVLCGRYVAPLLDDGDKNKNRNNHNGNNNSDDVNASGVGQFQPRFSGAWMPGVGLDSSLYISNLLAACDALAGMLGVTESVQHAQIEAQRCVYGCRHKLRVHVLRRFGFVNASKMWESPFSDRALSFLNALCISLHSSPCITVLRFRNGVHLPHSFGALDEPSPLLQSFASRHLPFPSASPCFCVECGTVQELMEMTAGMETETEKKQKKHLRCFFAPSGSEKTLCFEFLPRDKVLKEMADVAARKLDKEPESKFVDLAVYVEEGKILVRLLNTSLSS